MIIHIHPAELDITASPLSLARATGEQPPEQPPEQPTGSAPGLGPAAPPPVEPPVGPQSTAGQHRSSDPGPSELVMPRLCANCRRPSLAQTRSEYTAQRAALVAERGLCVCPTPPGTADSQLPAAAR